MRHELDATLQFGSREMPLREVLELGPGDVVELDRHVSEPVDLVVGRQDCGARRGRRRKRQLRSADYRGGNSTTKTGEHTMPFLTRKMESAEQYGQIQAVQQVNDGIGWEGDEYLPSKGTSEPGWFWTPCIA